MQHHEYNSESSFSPMALGFLAGLVAGSAAAMMFAPFSGEETRRKLRDGIASGRSRASEMLDAGKKRVADEARKFEEALSAGREAYRNGSPGGETTAGM